MAGTKALAKTDRLKLYLQYVAIFAAFSALALGIINLYRK